MNNNNACYTNKVLQALCYCWVVIAMLISVPIFAQDSTIKKTIPITYIAKDSNAFYAVKKLSLDTSITDIREINTVLTSIKQKMYSAGYYGFSVDSSVTINDSLYITLYAGPALKQLQLNLSSDVLPYVNGIVQNNTIKILPAYYDTLANAILLKAADKGYPFAHVQLDQLVFTNDIALANLVFNTGFQYKIDSIHIEDPEFLINKNFLTKYVGVTPNTLYSSQLLNNISYKINQLPYLQLNKPPSLELLNTGAYVNLDVKHKNANKANVLLGVVPANSSTANVIGSPAPTDNKYSIIGEAAISTWNLLGSGEFMSLRFD
jgi:hypothetical protein